MSRIDLKTLDRPLRQVGSPSNAFLDGLQNLAYPVEAFDDEIDDFTAAMNPSSYANFARKMLFLYEKPNFAESESKAVLQVSERGRNTLDCAIFVPVSVSFFQFAAGLQGSLSVRLLFADSQDAWWPEAGGAPRRVTATRFHVIPARS